MSIFKFIVSSFVFGIILLAAGPASADVWKWTDANGKIHFVDTNTAIFTWVENGKTFYSDTPDHEDAVAVQLVWVSKGSLQGIDSAVASTEKSALPGETPEQQAAREESEAYYCKRATEVYDSYKNAPRLYRTNDQGEREYLSEEDAETTMIETKAKVDQLCS